MKVEESTLMVNGSRDHPLMILSVLVNGSIPRIIEMSALVCLKLAAHEQGGTAARLDSEAPKRRKRPKHILRSPLHEAVKNGICDGLKGVRLWHHVDVQAKVDKKIKPLPAWAEFWPGGFEKAYKGEYKHTLDALTTRVRKSLGHSSD